MTTQGTESITIQAAPDVVWPWIADLGKHAAWSPKPYKVDLVSGEPGTVAGCRCFGADRWRRYPRARTVARGPPR